MTCMTIKNESVVCYDLLSLYKELINNEFFLSEAEEIDNEIRKKLALAEEEDENPYEITKSLLKEAERSKTALYDTYISSDYYDQFIEYWEIEWKKYYDRHRVFGLGGIYWILDNETQQEEGEYGIDEERYLYLRYDDAISVAAKRIKDSCEGYLESSLNYQEPTVYKRIDVEEYKATHDLAFRPSDLPVNYRGACPLPILRKIPEEIRLAFHEEEFANDEPDFIERLCQLQIVLSTAQEWRDRRLVVAIDDKRLPLDPRRISQRLVHELSDHAYNQSQISVWHTCDRTEAVINLDLPDKTQYGFEFALPVTEDRHLNALKVYLLKILQLAMDGTPNKLFYRKEICDTELAKLRTDIDSVVLFDENLAEQRARMVDFERNEERWNPMIYLAAEAPFPKKETIKYIDYIRAVCHGALNACQRVAKTDGLLEVMLRVGEEKYTFSADTIYKRDVREVLHGIEGFVDLLARDRVSPVIIDLDTWYQGYSTTGRLDIEKFRYELSETPADQPIHCFFRSVAESLSGQLAMDVREGRSDYALPVPHELEDSELVQWIDYPTVKLGKNPDQFFIEELAIEVWRNLQNVAHLPVDEAVDLVMAQAKFANRFNYAQVRSVRKAVMDTLLWEYANPKITNVVPNHEQRRRVLWRAFGVSTILEKSR